MSPRGERTLGLREWRGNGKRQEESGENGEMPGYVRGQAAALSDSRLFPEC